MAQVVAIRKSGGAQPGAGRPQGAKVIKSREEIDRWIKSGRVVPAYVMLEQMEWAYNQALRAHDRLEKLGGPDQADYGPKSKARKDAEEAMRVAMRYRDMAMNAAIHAARWVHPTLAQVTVQGDDDGGPVKVQTIRHVIIDPANRVGTQAIRPTNGSGDPEEAE